MGDLANPRALGRAIAMIGGRCRVRTDDLLGVNELLYQLS